MHLVGAGSAGAKKMCLEDLSKDMFLEVRNENVVKYCVYLDILLMGSVCVIKSTFLRGNPISGKKNIFKSAA